MPAQVTVPSTTHFLRFTPPDLAAVERDIVQIRLELNDALQTGDCLAILDQAGMLVGALTSTRAEREALDIGLAHLAAARAMPQAEESAWLLHGLATAAQYAGDRDQANTLFDEALQLCQSHGWRKLEHFVLHHWGRSKVEQGDFDGAEQCFQSSLSIRRELGDAKVQSSLRALEELAKLRLSDHAKFDHNRNHAI